MSNVNIESSKDKYILARWAYSLGDPIISDSEYNILHKYIKDNKLLPEYTNRTWSEDNCPIELLEKYNMTNLISKVIIMEKSKSLETINTFSDLNYHFGSLNTKTYLSLKEDGFNCQLNFFNGKLVDIHSRGRGNNKHINFNNLKEYITNQISLEGKVKIIGEAVISDKNYEQLKKTKETKSRRMAIRTCLADSELTYLIDFIAFDLWQESKKYTVSEIYNILNINNFKVVPYKIIYDYEQLKNEIKVMSESYNDYPYMTDGLVIRTDNREQEYAIRLGKWEESIHTSYILGYKQQYGSQNISALLEIYPIQLQNSRHVEIPITNISRIVENNLRVGSPVAFKMTSQVIATLDIETTKLLQTYDWLKIQAKVRQEEEYKSYIRA